MWVGKEREREKKKKKELTEGRKEREKKCGAVIKRGAAAEGAASQLRPYPDRCLSCAGACLYDEKKGGRRTTPE
ncbi:hypothetical protein CEXT_246291 [Caerostris extrusa]|uniref:Uncharacterized protein n=1 Tax=Caerostris extrusa TaxID=172846 RepID=A0AAV4R9E2_CAEEX|nr:hypothetical protein CEXT_246291 [Caerostris extrusa]